MNLSEIFSSVIIPKWVKGVITAIVLALVGLYFTMGYMGLTDIEGKPNWLEAAAHILGILLPVLLIGLVVVYAETGIGALRHRSYRYLTETIPQSAAILDDYNLPFDTKPVKWRSLQKDQRSIGLRMRSKPGGHYVLYELIAPAAMELEDGSREITLRRVLIGLELNVRKANVVVHVPAEKIDNSGAGAMDLKSLFPHSISGAVKEGYEFNPAASATIIDNKKYVSFVLIRQLSDKFLVQSTERLYFAQDLMFMIKALLNDAPDLFDAPSEPALNLPDVKKA